MNNSIGQDIIDAQHESLDATDAYASAWSVALAEASAAAAVRGGVIKPCWGGRGKGDAVPLDGPSSPAISSWMLSVWNT